MSRRPPRYPLVLLGVMTVLTFGGPLGIGYFLRGGASPNWPPDRPVEWAVLLGTSGMVVALMIGSLALGVVNHRAMTRASRPPVDPGEGRS